MKRLLLTFLLGALILNLSAQPWKQYFNNEKAPEEITLDDYRDAFYQWVNENEIVGGKKLVDGQWVKVPGYKQFRRWEHYWESRVNKADNSFPNTSAYDELQKYHETKSGDVWAGNWTSMGPSSTPGGYAGLGRVNCIEFHPTDNNTFWIGTPAGGLWKTTDGGTTWRPLTDQNGVLGVSDIALANDFETSNTMFIATGDRAGGSLWALGGNNANDNNSIGVLKSTDGGETWTETGLSFLPKDRIVLGRLLIDPNDGNIMIAGATDGIYRSEDGGETWTKSVNNFFAIDMEFHPTNSDIVYATNGSGSIRFMKSTDNGITFETIDYFSNSVRGEIAVSPAAPGRVYILVANTAGGLEGIYKSTDSGESLTKEFDGNSTNGSLMGYYSNGSGENTGQGSYDLCIAASPTNADEVFIGGINTWKSNNAGSNWGISNVWTGGGYYNPNGAPIAHADKHVLKYRPSDGALFEGNDGGIYKSTNNGSTWQDLSNGLEITQIYRLGVSASNPNMVIIGNQDNGSKLITGSNWRDVTGGDGMECLIDYVNPAIQYATYVDGKLYKTVNTWNSRTTISDNIPGGENGAWVSPYMIDPANPATLYVGYDKLWKSTNRGASWTRLGNISSNNDKFRSMAICQSNNNVMLVADLSTVHKTSNGGTSWTNATGNISTSNNITNVAIHAENQDIMWATTGGYTPSRVYQSTNGGTSWVDISSGLPQIPVYTIVHNKLQTEHLELYIGTELGVWMKSGDNDWIPYMKNLPNVVVTELEIYYGDDAESSKLRAATFGRGLWETDLFAIKAAFTATPTSGEAPLEVQFSNQSMNANIFFWSFGDGTSTETNPTKIYQNEGVYSVKLTAYNDFGNSAISEKTDFITITPNGIELTNESPFNIYPNPGNGLFTIKGTEKYSGQSIDVKLINTNGKIIKSIPMIFGDTNTIDLTNEASGIYYLFFPFKNNHLMNKIIIQ